MKPDASLDEWIEFYSPAKMKATMNYEAMELPIWALLVELRKYREQEAGLREQQENFAALSEPTVWAIVVAEGDTGKLLWETQETGSRETPDHMSLIELKADTFPLGTRLQICEPEDKT